MEGLVRRRARILNTLVTTGAPQATDGSMRDRRTRGRSHQCMAERLRQRIFKATRDGDWAKVRNLQKLMLRSLSNTLVSVRQVTQGFSGRRLPLPSGQSYPRLPHSIAEVHVTRHHQGFIRIHPSGLPLTCSRRMARQPLGLNSELHTPPLPVTHVGAGTGVEHSPGTTRSSEPPFEQSSRHVRPRVARPTRCR